MKNLVDITKDLISKINLDLEILSIVGNKISFCGTTLFLTKDKTVTIEGLEYTVTLFKINEWIEVAPLGHVTPVPPTATIVTLPPITFLHGSPASTSEEYTHLSVNSSDKTPFIWLLESYGYDDMPLNSSIEKEFKAKIFFLDWANIKFWSNENHNDNVIKPMENLKEAFIDVINEDYNFKRLETTKTIVRPRFGVIKNNKGSEKRIIEDDLSGVEFDATIKVYSLNECCS